MTQKSGTYTCLRLIFVVLAFVALASSSCVDEYEEMLKDPNHEYMYVSRLLKPEEDLSVKEMAAAAAEEYNRRSKSSCQYEALMDEGLKALQAGEFGIGICVQVTLEPKDSQNGELCEDGEKMTCVIEASMDWDDYILIIDRDRLQCTAATA